MVGLIRRQRFFEAVLSSNIPHEEITEANASSRRIQIKDEVIFSDEEEDDTKDVPVNDSEVDGPARQQTNRLKANNQAKGVIRFMENQASATKEAGPSIKSKKSILKRIVSEQQQSARVSLISTTVTAVLCLMTPDRLSLLL